MGPKERTIRKKGSYDWPQSDQHCQQPALLKRAVSCPDGFKGGKLNGTHNEQNAITELQGRGAAYLTTPTNTPGVNELNHQVTNPNTGKSVSGAKTTYDPAIYSDQKMLDMAQQAGKRAFEARKADPTKMTFDLNEGGVKFRIYINIDKTTGAPYFGNVHPIQ